MPHRASCTGLSPSTIRLSRRFHSPSMCNGAVLQPRGGLATVTVWALPRSLATTGGIIRLFSLPRGTKMFQFPRLASGMIRIGGLLPPGLSHSEIRGSMAICAYPRLIAAYHVLLRLNEPRHPPCALSYFRLSLLYPSTWDRGRRPYFSCVLWMSPTGGLYLAYDNLAAAQALQSCLCQYVKDLFPLFQGYVENIGVEPAGRRPHGRAPWPGWRQADGLSNFTWFPRNDRFRRQEAEGCETHRLKDF